MTLKTVLSLTAVITTVRAESAKAAAFLKNKQASASRTRTVTDVLRRLGHLYRTGKKETG